MPLKQAGRQNFGSESQERMTVGVSEQNAEAFEALAKLHEVEATAVGTFTDSGSFLNGQHVVADLPIIFFV